MSMEYIRKTYGVPAKRGGRVKFTDVHRTVWNCTIKSARGGYLMVLADDRVAGYRGRMKLHPTWNVEYMPSNAEVRGASRLAGEASSAEGATSTVVLEGKEDKEK